jgi:hypothetical protein
MTLERRSAGKVGRRQITSLKAIVEVLSVLPDAVANLLHSVSRLPVVFDYVFPNPDKPEPNKGNF